MYGNRYDTFGVLHFVRTSLAPIWLSASAFKTALKTRSSNWRSASLSPFSPSLFNTSNVYINHILQEENDVALFVASNLHHFTGHYLFWESPTSVAICLSDRPSLYNSAILLFIGSSSLRAADSSSSSSFSATSSSISKESEIS